MGRNVKEDDRMKNMIFYCKNVAENALFGGRAVWILEVKYERKTTEPGRHREKGDSVFIFQNTPCNTLIHVSFHTQSICEPFTFSSSLIHQQQHHPLSRRFHLFHLPSNHLNPYNSNLIQWVPGSFCECEWIKVKQANEISL